MFERHHQIEHSTMILYIVILNATSATKNLLVKCLLALLNVKQATGVAAILLHCYTISDALVRITSILYVELTLSIQSFVCPVHL